MTLHVIILRRNKIVHVNSLHYYISISFCTLIFDDMQEISKLFKLKNKKNKIFF